MVAKAESKFVIISPKKVWRITRELRGKSYKEAMEILRELPQKAAKMIQKLLKSAFYNGLQKDNNLSEEDAIIEEIYVNLGPVYKRMRPRAQGRAGVVKKRTSHIKAILVTREAN